ncbi:MAG: hypothetical protein ACI8P0_004014 [Planctomycetaceae bacterium]|jgi:hypothetical protein
MSRTMESIALSAAANSRWLIAAITVCIGSVCVGDELPEPLPVSVTSDQRVDALMRELTTLKGRINQLEENSTLATALFWTIRLRADCTLMTK